MGHARLEREASPSRCVRYETKRLLVSRVNCAYCSRLLEATGGVKYGRNIADYQQAHTCASSSVRPVPARSAPPAVVPEVDFPQALARRCALKSGTASCLAGAFFRALSLRLPVACI